MSELLDALDRTIRGMVEGRDVAVAFSGGLDSGVVAAIVKKYASSAVLYTVGAEGSYDVEASCGLSEVLGMEWVHIPMDEDSLRRGLAETVAITGTTDPVMLSFEVPLMYILPRMKEAEVIGGQGSDEMLWGYSKYLDLSEDELRKKAAEDLGTLNGATKAHESAMAGHYGKKVLYPFLSKDVADAVSRIPFADMVPVGDDRKRPLKAVALELGYPEIAEKRKKAAQYGTGSMNMIKKMAKAEGRTVSEFITSIADGGMN